MSRQFDIVLLLIILILLPGCANIKNVDTFEPAGLIRGSIMSEDMCHFAETSVWVVVSGKGECIRYFHAGLKDKNPMVHIWFHGDRLAHYWSGGVPGSGSGRITHTEVISYADSSPDNLQRYANREYETFNIPFIRFSRPGVYGSSSDHNQKRRPREIEIINAALETIKKKYRIDSFILSGQSGGGHIVASLLALRNDISCAVITSGAVAVGKRIEIKGWRTDSTGYADYYDPIEHVNEIAPNDKRPIFIVGDPRDENVPFTTQEAYYEELKKCGHQVWLIRADGQGKEHHELSLVGFRIVKWWVDGISAEEIIKRSSEFYN